MSTLPQQGFFFVMHKNGKYAWVHPADIREDDIDCTDMGDAEFEQFVQTIDADPVF